MVQNQIMIRNSETGESWSVKVPNNIARKIDLDSPNLAVIVLGRKGIRSGALLTGKEWREKVEDAIESMVAYAIQDPPYRATIIKNAAELIKLLQLEET